MALTDNPFDSLDNKYPQAKYGDGSFKKKAFFEQGSHEASLIPFEDRIVTLAKFVFEGYDMHKLVNDYLVDKDALDDDTRKHGIAGTFKAYADEIFFIPDTDDWKEAVKKLLIGDENKTSSEQLREAIDAFIEVVNVHLNKYDFIKPSELPIYLFRTNYEPKDAYGSIEKLIDDLYENNILSINVKDKFGDDEKYFCDIFNGEKEKKDLKKQYIHRFYQLVSELQNSDVIVIAEYKGKSSKIGLVKKGSPVICKNEEGEIYKLYCLQMDDVKDIPDNRKHFVGTLIPKNVTISRIINKKGVIYNIYYGTPIPFELSSVSDFNLEELCAEYLRSCLSFKFVRKLANNYPDIDIIGYNNNELVTAQVSRTLTKNLIEEKKEKLCSFGNAKYRIMFSMLPTEEDARLVNYCIQDVWDYFERDESNHEFLKGLIEFEK